MILKGRSVKGKNRIRELGNQWEVICQRGTVQFSNRPGPWLYIKPLGGDQTRWIQMNNDVDFEIVAK